MKRQINWETWGAVLALLFLFVVLLLLQLWSYDWDPRCLLVECRRLK